MAFWLHIGMEKAGSTAIQTFLINNNSGPLARHGFKFTQFGRQGRLEVFKWFDKEIKKSLIDELKEKPNIIVSSGSGYCAKINVIEEIASVHKETKIIIYLRDPVSWSNSYYNQKIRAGRVSYADLMEFSTSLKDGICERLNVGRYLENWESVVGRSNIRVVPYAPTINVYDTFLDWIGIPGNAREQFAVSPRNPNKAANVSSLRIMLEVKRRIGDHDPDRLLMAQAIGKKYLRDRYIDTRTDPPLMLLMKEEREKIRERYSSEYEKVYERYGVEFHPKSHGSRDVRQVGRDELTTLKSDEVKVVSKILRSTSVKSYVKRCEGIIRRGKFIARDMFSAQH